MPIQKFLDKEAQGSTDTVNQLAQITAALSLSQQLHTSFNGQDLDKFVQELEEHFLHTNIEGDAWVL